MNRLLVLPATGLLLALTACGGSGSGGGAAAPASNNPSNNPSINPSAVASLVAAASSAASAAGAGTSSSSGSVDVCTVLPVSDVSRITGVHYTTAKGDSTMGQIFGCEYGNASFNLLQVSVTVANGALDYSSDLQALDAVGFKPAPVSGVGDKAFAMPKPTSAGAEGAAGFASYGALFGDVYIKIGGSYVSADQGKQLVEEIHAAM